MSKFIIIACIILAIILFVVYELHTFRFGVVSMINGGVKSGKTCLVVAKAISAQRSAMLKYYLSIPIKAFKEKVMKVPQNWEIPLIYSNIPIKSKYYVPLTTDIIKREKRMNYKSACILSEVSLVANSMNYKDDLLNEQVELFIKLYGHATKGGTLWIDTQAMGDNHYAIKRSIDTTCWIERTIKIPFFIIYRVRKLMVCDENTINTNTGNPDEDCRTILVPKSTWRKYDRYCYSVFTDSKPIVDTFQDSRKRTDLKARKVPTFRKFKTLRLEKIKMNNEKVNFEAAVEAAAKVTFAESEKLSTTVTPYINTLNTVTAHTGFVGFTQDVSVGCLEYVTEPKKYSDIESDMERYGAKSETELSISEYWSDLGYTAAVYGNAVHVTNEEKYFNFNIVDSKAAYVTNVKLIDIELNKRINRTLFYLKGLMDKNDKG